MATEAAITRAADSRAHTQKVLVLTNIYRGKWAKNVLILPAALLLAASFACGSAVGPEENTTPQVRPEPETTITFDKPSVDLGTVMDDQLGVQTFLVGNRGDQALMVGPATIRVEQGCDQVATAMTVTEVFPGELSLLPVQFGRYKVLGPHNIVVAVPSTDLNAPMTELRVVFDVAKGPPQPAAADLVPRLRVDKSEINAGSIPFDWPLYEEFTLRNDGHVPLVIEHAPSVTVVEGC